MLSTVFKAHDNICGSEEYKEIRCTNAYIIFKDSNDVISQPRYPWPCISNMKNTFELKLNHVWNLRYWSIKLSTCLAVCFLCSAFHWIDVASWHGISSTHKKTHNADHWTIFVFNIKTLLNNWSSCWWWLEKTLVLLVLGVVTVTRCNKFVWFICPYYAGLPQRHRGPSDIQIILRGWLNVLKHNQRQQRPKSADDSWDRQLIWIRMNSTVGSRRTLFDMLLICNSACLFLVQNYRTHYLSQNRYNTATPA